LDLLMFNIIYNVTTFPRGRYRLNLLGCYLFLIYTGYRPARIVDNEKKKPKDDGIKDELSDKLVEAMLATETLGRGRPKVLCYKDILLIVVRHPVTGEDTLVMAVKFIHYKGADNKLKLYVLVYVHFASSFG
ncbi:hypothetical protein C8A01DRAFT_21072, partial [Parachaetomium inaequale]